MMKCLPLLLVLYALLPSSGEAQECNRVNVVFSGRLLGEYGNFEATVENPEQGHRFTKDSSKEDFANGQFIFLGQKSPHTHVNSKPVFTIKKVNSHEIDKVNSDGVTFERILDMLQSMGTWKYLHNSKGRCEFSSDLSWPEDGGPLDFLHHLATLDEIESRRRSGVAIIRIIFLLLVDGNPEKHFLDFQHAFVPNEDELSEQNTEPKSFGSAADYMFWEGIGQYKKRMEDAPGYLYKGGGWSAVVDMPYSRPEKEDDGDVRCFWTPSGGMSVQVTDEAICNRGNWEAVARESSTSGRTAEYDETNRQVFHVLRYLSDITRPKTPKTPVVYVIDQTQTRKAGKLGRMGVYGNRKKKHRMDNNKKKRQNNDR